MLRKTLTTNSNFLATSLHLARHALLTTYFTSFLISGIIHATGH
jgi:hypothetical protein